MRIIFGETTNDIVKIEHCRLMYRNFEGREEKFNKPGNRNFNISIPDVIPSKDDLVIPEKLAEELAENEANRIRETNGEPEPITFAKVLNDFGFNVRVRNSKKYEGQKLYRLPVIIRLRDNEPTFIMDEFTNFKIDNFGNAVTGLPYNPELIHIDHSNIGIIDKMSIIDADVEIRMHKWTTPTGEPSNTAYLKNIYVRQKIDGFALNYEHDNEHTENHYETYD